MRRVGAVAVAVAMVVLALYARSQWIEGGGGGGGGTRGRIRLLCATELEAACTRLAERDDNVQVTVEPAGDTAVSLAKLSDPQRSRLSFDGWLVPSPWPEIVDVTRRVNGLQPVFGQASQPIARSPLVLVARASRVPRLKQSQDCNGTVDWRCVGAVAGKPWTDLPGGQAAWGAVKPGHAEPTASATGLLVLSQATSEFLGRSDYSRADLENNDQYIDWLTSLERAIPDYGAAGGTPFEEMIQRLPAAAFDVVGTFEAEAGPALYAAAPDRKSELALIYPQPVVTADVTLAPVNATGRRADATALARSDDLGAALAHAGWRVPGKPVAKGVTDSSRLRLSRPSGLPVDPGVLVALQETWRGVPR